VTTRIAHNDVLPPQSGLGPQAQSHTVRTRLDDLARRYYAPLATFFRKRTHNAAEVQDLVQQVFLRLAQHRELGDIRNFEGYIFQTAAKHAQGPLPS